MDRGQPLSLIPLGSDPLDMLNGRFLWHDLTNSGHVYEWMDACIHRHAPGTTHDVRTSICHATGRSDYDEPDEDANLAYRDAVFTNTAIGQ